MKFLVFAAFLVSVTFIVCWFVTAPGRAEQKAEKRAAKFDKEMALLLSRSTALLERILDVDSNIPSLTPRHKDEAESILSQYKKQLPKGE